MSEGKIDCQYCGKTLRSWLGMRQHVHAMRENGATDHGVSDDQASKIKHGTTITASEWVLQQKGLI